VTEGNSSDFMHDVWPEIHADVWCVECRPMPISCYVFFTRLRWAHSAFWFVL